MGFNSAIKNGMEREDPKRIVQKYWGNAGVELFDRIIQQAPQKADVIVLLQGDRFDRAPATFSLFQKRIAPTILISGNNVLVGPNTRPEENDVELNTLKGYLMEHGVPETSICIDDQSFNNLGQATNVVKTAQEKGWRVLLVVVSAYHALRAFLSLVKQIKGQGWDGKIIMHAIEFPWDVSPSGRVKSAQEMLGVEMEKIQKYAKDIASIEEGFAYLKTS